MKIQISFCVKKIRYEKYRLFCVQKKLDLKNTDPFCVQKKSDMKNTNLFCVKKIRSEKYKSVLSFHKRILLATANFET